MIKELAHILTSPINQTIIVIAVCTLLTWKTLLPKATSKVIIIATLAWLYLCSQPFFSAMLIRPFETEFAPVNAQDTSWQDADAIWVLACNHYNEPELPDVSRWNPCSLQRLVHAYQMYHVKPTQIYVTGGVFSQDTSFKHAQQAKAFLIRLGVHSDAITAINVGTNTREELTALLQHEGIKDLAKLAIVSSATHGTRIEKLMTLKLLSGAPLRFQFIPVEHLTADHVGFSLGWPQIKSIEKSQRAIYAFMANIELALLN